ncbi:MAG: hypothetical protein H6599_09980 [Flavobacteriales bacterium]|nr:hypothetical protein [Flavobacteriales bacterium]
MQRSKWIFILFLVFSNLSWGQDSTSVASEKPIKKAKLLFAFDARRSYVLNNKVKFNGIKIGVELYEKHRVGLGFYWLQQPVNFVGKIDHIQYPEATDTLLFNFSYSGLFYDYVWLRTKRWELTTPVHLGVGGIELKYLDTAGHVNPTPFIKGGSYVFGVGGSVQFKVWRWFALGTGGGYRTMLTHEENIKKPLNAPYYQFQVKILLGEIYRMVFRRETLDEW